MIPFLFCFPVLHMQFPKAARRSSTRKPEPQNRIRRAAFGTKKYELRELQKYVTVRYTTRDALVQDQFDLAAFFFCHVGDR